MATRPLAAQAWAAAAALALHNAEEVLGGLPAWGRAYPRYSLAIWSDRTFAVLATVLVLAAGCFALWCQCSTNRWQNRVLGLFTVVMLFNVASHLALSVMTASRMPGLLTALSVNLPVFGCIVWRTAAGSSRK